MSFTKRNIMIGAAVSGLVAIVLFVGIVTGMAIVSSDDGASEPTTARSGSRDQSSATVIATVRPVTQTAVADATLTLLSSAQVDGATVVAPVDPALTAVEAHTAADDVVAQGVDLPAAATSTPIPSPAPPPVNAERGPCLTNCGTPQYFCDAGSWAFCDDYRDLYCPSQNFLNDCKFPDMDGVGRHVSVVTYSSTDPGYYPQRDSTYTPHGWFFNQQEHFHSQIEDGSFGIAMVRHHQPIDLTAERRIHFEIDLKTSARRYVRLMLSPQVTKSMVDDRDAPEEFRPGQALDIWFQNGTFVGSVYPSSPDGTAFFVQSPRYYGTDNVRDIVDVYVSKTNVRIDVNGSTYVDTSIPNIGFDQAYVYLSQASYNPCKDDECGENLQTFHWDNFAFDGPALADNGLVPGGYQDVVFMAYGQTSCRVKGVAATPGSSGDSVEYTWMSWVARMPIQPVSVADVDCTDGQSGHLWNNTERTPFDFEVVSP